MTNFAGHIPQSAKVNRTVAVAHIFLLHILNSPARRNMILFGVCIYDNRIPVTGGRGNTRMAPRRGRSILVLRLDRSSGSGDRDGLCLNNPIHNPGPVSVNRKAVRRGGIYQKIAILIKIVAFRNSVVVAVNPLPGICRIRMVVILIPVTVGVKLPGAGKNRDG